ncbi:hypothetical protein, partial [Petrotoga sp. DB-2]
RKELLLSIWYIIRLAGWYSIRLAIAYFINVYLKSIKKTVENHMEKCIIKLGRMKIACNKCFLNKD